MSSRSVLSNAQLHLCGTHALPSLVTNSDSLTTFKSRKLKTYLFR